MSLVTKETLLVKQFVSILKISALFVKKMVKTEVFEAEIIMLKKIKWVEDTSRRNDCSFHGFST